MKINKKIGWSALAICAFILAGCGNKNAPNNQGAANNTSNPIQSATENVKQSLYGLMTSGAGVKCTIQDPKMGELTMSAKGDKAKVEGFSFIGGFPSGDSAENAQPQQEKGTMINDGTWAYMWSGQKGMKFNINDMKSLAQQNQNGNQDNSQNSASDWKDWVKHMDEVGTKYDCSPAVLSDSDFTPPTDVAFQDWGEIMKGFVKMGQDLKNKIPANPGSPPQ